MQSITLRSLLIAALLLAAVAVQARLDRAVRADAPPVAPKLQAALSLLPLQIGPWHGQDLPVPPEAAFGDDRLHRLYCNPATGQAVTVWITLSSDGEDRGHYPQVCMAVAGKVEDIGRRAEIALPGGGAPIAESYFGPATEAVRTWYWHYALPSTTGQPISALARTYHRARQRGASLSLELLAADPGPVVAVSVRQLSVLIDEAVQPLLPAGAIRGSDRLPVEFAQ